MLEIVKIFSADLETGMYVSSLDRPWLETPFSLQGFQLESEEDVLRLQEYCQYVYIDSAKSVQDPAIIRRKVRNRPRKSTQQLFSNRALKKYKDGSGWGEEYPKAQAAVQVLSEGIDDIFGRLAGGGSLDMVRVKKSVEPMIDSISRNPDACIWLARMKQEDKYTYQHSLGASIWAVALGRQLGLPKSDLRSLAIGGLLFDVGKLGVETELLNTERPLTDDEFQQVRDHVKLGVDMIEGSGLMNQDVIDMITYHHERHDGSGYPKGIRGDDIPVFARIAAIVDCYDAITSHRSYARAIPPSTAIKMLYEWKDIDFQGELVEEFIQAVGIYPAGTLVELSSGEVAVVVAEYRTRRLRPQVMVLLDADKQALADIKTIDLRSRTTMADGKPLDITGSLEPDAYGIDMTAIQL
ncbi:MAG TPA: HD-GYP domain-containing protein [Halieaceae bacterium]|nr:HD-GYP domain-containing protein [Halieaceae bacterium]